MNRWLFAFVCAWTSRVVMAAVYMSSATGEKCSGSVNVNITKVPFYSREYSPANGKCRDRLLPQPYDMNFPYCHGLARVCASLFPSDPDETDLRWGLNDCEMNKSISSSELSLLVKIGENFGAPPPDYKNGVWSVHLPLLFRRRPVHVTRSNASSTSAVFFFVIKVVMDTEEVAFTRLSGWLFLRSEKSNGPLTSFGKTVKFGREVVTSSGWLTFPKAVEIPLGRVDPLANSEPNIVADLSWNSTVCEDTDSHTKRWR